MSDRSGLFLRKETVRGIALSWYDEPFGRIYRDPTDAKRWLGEFWDGRAKQTVWDSRLDAVDAAVLCFQKWAEATRTDIMATRYDA